MYVKYITFTFTAGVSDNQPLSETSVIGLITPASFGATSLSLLAGENPDTTPYLPVFDCGNALVTFTVDPSAARHYDFTDDFPASVKNIKIKSEAGSIPDGTKVKLVVKKT